MSFEGTDIFLVDVVGRIHDGLENRFGRLIAWIATFLLPVAVLAAIGGVAWYFLWR